MTVFFDSWRNVNSHATVHYHPFRPSTLDQTRDSLDFSGTNIYLCGHRYFQYPVVTDIYVSPSHHTSRNFPTLTICLNSMHADFKVKQFHDDDGKLSDSLRPVSKNNCSYIKAKFRDNSKFSFPGHNCHLNNHHRKFCFEMAFSRKISKNSPIYIFLIFPQKCQLRIENQNFEISRNSAYSFSGLWKKSEKISNLPKDMTSERDSQ